MARLIISVVAAETSGSDVVGNLLMYVSVSRADDGAPVTGLTASNFRLTSSIGIVIDTSISLCTESKWEPGDNEGSGCYELWISRTGPNQGPGKWGKGEYYQFGVQARVFSGKKAVDFGQAAVDVQSLGT